jgi:hypothetical protein
MTFLWTILVSFLPARYRAKSRFEGSDQLRRAVLFSGVCQVVIFTFLFIGAFITHAQGIWEQSSNIVLNGEKGPMMDPVQVRLTTGTLSVLMFLSQPLHLLYAYLAVEGAVRAFFGFVFSHILPTLPLWLICVVQDAIESPAKRARASILAKDVIEPAHDGSYDLHVRSHLPKTWTPYIGIQFQGELYVLDGEENGPGPHSHGYRLRKSPPGNLVAVTCSYVPEVDAANSFRVIRAIRD